MESRRSPFRFVERLEGIISLEIYFIIDEMYKYYEEN